jgi:hypothetical protein
MSRILLLTTLAATVVLTGCPTQAPAPCQIQPSGNGPYTLKLTNTGAVTGACPATMGDQWFFDNYANGLIAMVDFATYINGTISVPPFPDPTSSIYGRGTFSTSDPDSNDLCTLPTVNKFDGPVPGSSWSVNNLSFLSTALYIGTQWKGDVTYYPPGGGTCSYKAQALNPSTACATNADCNPTSEPTNSGINSLYNQGCVTDDWAKAVAQPFIENWLGGTYNGEGMCFLLADFPSLGGFKP